MNLKCFLNAAVDLVSSMVASWDVIDHRWQFMDYLWLRLAVVMTRASANCNKNKGMLGGDYVLI